VAYDEELAKRLRRLLPRATEKRMFGGVGLMERGNLVAGVSHDDLVVRVPPDETARWLRETGAHPMMPGKSMQGWVKVASRAVREEAVLAAWVERSRAYAKTLPAK
jgi:TfoX/Sxy family transcriptional regulator of competence genes